MTILTVLALALVAAPPAPKLRTTPKLAIEYAIELLEKGDHKGFIKECLRPDSLKKFLETGATIDDAVELAERRGAHRQMLEVLKRIRNREPKKVIRASGTETYYFKLEEGGGISFVRFGREWYINL